MLALLALGCAREPEPKKAAPAAPSASVEVPSSPWPELPSSPEAARQLIAQQTRRKARVEPPLTSESLQASLAKSAEKNELSAGLAAIAFRLSAQSEGRASFVLFGSYHDAAAQIAAFRKLAGPLGYGPSDATLEQLHAPGRWKNVEASAQLGDRAVLEALARGADRGALDALVASQRDHNYTAWKYDYLEELPALAATLGSSGVHIHGCDLPSGLQDRVKGVGDAELSGLRELHCVLALHDRLRAGPVKVAMLWGARHAAADGAQRFLPPDADVREVQLFGGRPAGDGVEAKLAEQLRLTEPVLFPVEGKERWALVLAEGALQARADRVRTEVLGEDAARLGKLVVTSEREVELWVGGKLTRVGPKPAEIALGPGPHAFWTKVPDGVAVAGLAPMPEHGFVELWLDPRAGSVRLTVHRGR